MAFCTSVLLTFSGITPAGKYGFEILPNFHIENSLLLEEVFCSSISDSITYSFATSRELSSFPNSSTSGY